jgi:hypothetical protein
MLQKVLYFLASKFGSLKYMYMYILRISTYLQNNVISFIAVAKVLLRSKLRSVRDDYIVSFHSCTEKRKKSFYYQLL